jgi:hypothetical protein
MTISSSFAQLTILPTMSDLSTTALATPAHSVTPASTIAARLTMTGRCDPEVVKRCYIASPRPSAGSNPKG